VLQPLAEIGCPRAGTRRRVSTDAAQAAGQSTARCPGAGCRSAVADRSQMLWAQGERRLCTCAGASRDSNCNARSMAADTRTDFAPALERSRNCWLAEALETVPRRDAPRNPRGLSSLRDRLYQGLGPESWMASV
jgi:hypothetical protein